MRRRCSLRTFVFFTCLVLLSLRMRWTYNGTSALRPTQDADLFVLHASASRRFAQPIAPFNLHPSAFPFPSADRVRMAIRSIAVNAPGSHVLLLADARTWRHLRGEITSQRGVFGLNLWVVNLDAICPLNSYKIDASAHGDPAKAYPSNYLLSLISALSSIIAPRSTWSSTYGRVSYLYKPHGYEGLSKRGMYRQILMLDAYESTVQNNPFDGIRATLQGSSLLISTPQSHLYDPPSPPHGASSSLPPSLPNVVSCEATSACIDLWDGFLLAGSASALRRLVAGITHRGRTSHRTSPASPKYPSISSGAKGALSSPLSTTPSSAESSILFDCYRNKSISRRLYQLYNQPINQPLPVCKTDKMAHTSTDTNTTASSVRADTCKFRPQSALLYDRVERVLARKERLPLCIGVLTFKGFHTLNNTLHTYVAAHLFDIVEESVFLFQSINSTERHAYANYFIDHFPVSARNKYIFESNNTVFASMSRIARECSSKYTMILEEDFAIYVPVEEVIEQLVMAMYMIEELGMSAIRMRHRYYMGEPDVVLNHYRRYLSVPSQQTISHVAWAEDVEDALPDRLYVCAYAPKAVCTTNAFAGYTNNPTLYPTSFLRDIMALARVDTSEQIRRFEPHMIKTLRPKSYGVGWSTGIFTHHRLDRSGTVAP